MNKFLQGIAAKAGMTKLYEGHGHHVFRMSKVILAGGVGFIVQTLIFEIGGLWLGIVSASTATLVGAECAILINFYINERFAFRDAEKSSPTYKRLLKFHIVCSGSLIIQWASVFCVEHLTASHVALNAAYIMGVGIGFLFNYVGYYLFVWRRN